MHGLMSYRRFGRARSLRSDRTLVRARSLRSDRAEWAFGCYAVTELWLELGRYWSSCTSTGTLEVHINGGSGRRRRRRKQIQALAKKNQKVDGLIKVSKVSKKNLRLGHSKEIKDEGGKRRTWLRAWLKLQVWRKTVTPEISC
ncbi:hypothetical protein F2Q70_00003412 [Brassica cretica]|uniref:Uncharacterized protein n=1 Tax=Brassica cretica TaxID=69181 RepID=A0A8S9ITT5_BRACR|nr:hypothetical protein F2Q70_00003412 [Brassica cretica]